MKEFQHVNEGAKSDFKIPLKSEYGSVLFITLVWYDNKTDNYKSAFRQISVAPDSSILLNVKNFSKQKFYPGELCTLKYEITNNNTSHPVPSEFSAAVVDEAVFALADEKGKGVLHSLSPHSYSYPCSLFSEDDAFNTECERRIHFIDSFSFDSLYF